MSRLLVGSKQGRSATAFERLRWRSWYGWMWVASLLPAAMVKERATRESVEKDVLSGHAFWFDAEVQKFFRKEARRERKLIAHYARLGFTPAPDEQPHEFIERAKLALFPLDRDHWLR